MKQSLSLLLLLLATACDSSSSEPPTSSQALIQGYWTAWQRADWDAYAAALADDVVVEFGGGGKLRGKPLVRQVSEAGNAWHSVTMTDEHYWAEGGTIVYDAVDSVTGSTMRVAELIRVAEGKIVHVSAVVRETRPPVESSNVPRKDVPFVELQPDIPNGPTQAFLYGLPEKTPTGYFLRFTKDMPSPPHRHSHGYRAVVVEGVMRNGPDIDAAVDMPAGSFWSQKANETHVTACVSEEPCLEFVAFTGPFDFLPAEQ